MTQVIQKEKEVINNNLLHILSEKLIYFNIILYALDLNNFEFTATMNAPIQYITKIFIKFYILLLADASASDIEKKRPIIKGPQRSQCFNSLLASYFSFGSSNNTYLIFIPIPFKSRS